MFGSVILEVAIGLALVYLLLSLICSALQESLESRLKIRAIKLEKGLRELLKDPHGTELLKDLYNHPLLYGLFGGTYDPSCVRKKFTTNLPTYIPSANFALALMDTIVHGAIPGTSASVPAGELSVASLRAAVTSGKALNPSVQRILLLALDSSHGDLANVQTNIEKWFDSSMERVSGWYKRHTQGILLGMGLLVAILLNVNTVTVATELYHNSSLRTAIVSQAEAAAKGDKQSSPDVARQIATLDKLNLPIGWHGKPVNPLYEDFWIFVGTSLIGWLVTAFAISFGAPFWFDLLNKFITIRSTAKTQTTTTTPAPGATRASGAGTVTHQMPPSSAGPNVTVPTLPVAAPITTATFQPHEWVTGGDPKGDIL